MLTLRYLATLGQDTRLIQKFASLAGVTGARLVATNVNSEQTTITDNIVVSGNTISMVIPANYNVASNYPTVVALQTTPNGSTWTSIATLYGSLRGGALPENVSGFAPGQTLATAINQTGVTTTFGNNPTNTIIPHTQICIPPITTDVWLEWGVSIGVSVGGQGAIVTKIYEISPGIVYLEGSVTYCLPSQTVSSAADVQRGRIRVGPSPVMRQYGMYGSTLQEAGSSLAGYARNFAGSVASTWLTAVTR